MKIYYKVKEEYDNKPIQSNNKDLFYIKNELFTEAEVKKLKVNINYCEKILANPKDTFCFFGARFLK